METRKKTIKTGTLYRSFELNRAQVNDENRTVELAFSSEAPVERYFGIEILDHTPASVRLGRLTSGGAVLVDHDPSDHVGVVESITIDSDRVGRAQVRFGKGARAEEIFQDVKDGIRRNVSVGYLVHRMQLESESKGVETFRITDWEPFEVSIVSIPADATVGIGRAAETKDHETIIEVRHMEVENKEVKPAPAVDVREIENKVRRAEQQRVADIMAIGNAYEGRVSGMRALADKFVAEGKNVDEFRAAALERMGSAAPLKVAESPALGLSEKETRQFSILRAINALSNPSDRRAQQAAAYEYEVSQAAAERLKKEARGIIIPSDILKRDLTVGTATAGGHTVATNLLTGSFIDMLVARMVVAARATRLTDLNGNIAIPRQTGGASAYWVAESGVPTESQQAFDQVALSPKTVGAFTDISRKLLIQSGIDVEQFVRMDLARTLALELDRVCIEGSGSGNEPRGILNTTGIGDVAGGTNGLAPAWSHIVNLESEVAADNADIGSLAYITNAKVRGKLKQTEKASGTAQFVWDGTELNGYPALVSNQVPSDLTKGTGTNLSAILFGNFADLLLGMWGGLDLTVDPYTFSTSGTVRVVVLQDVDLAVRHAESFAAMKDAVIA